MASCKFVGWVFGLSSGKAEDLKQYQNISELVSFLHDMPEQLVCLNKTCFQMRLLFVSLIGVLLLTPSQTKPHGVEHCQPDNMEILPDR